MSRFGVGIRYTLNRSAKKQGTETMKWEEVWLLQQRSINLYTYPQPAERVTTFLGDTDIHCETLSFSILWEKGLNVFLIIQSFTHSSTSVACILCVCVCVCVCVCLCVCACACAQLCLTLWDAMDCSPPHSSVHGISWARILPFPSPCVLYGGD